VTASVAYYAGFTAISAPPTGQDGKAILYNISTTATQVRVVGTLDPAVEADAGFVPGSCQFDGGLNQYTGTCHILPSALTAFVYDLP
jgi:hypothetical protein